MHSEEVKVTRRYAGEAVRKRGGLNEGHTSDSCRGDPGDRILEEVTTCNHDTEKDVGSEIIDTR